MTPKHGYRGYKWCVLRCAFEDRKTALAVLARYPFISESPAPAYRDGSIQFEIDLSMLPHPGDGMAMEEIIIRDLQRAVSLHTVKP